LNESSGQVAGFVLLLFLFQQIDQINSVEESDSFSKMNGSNT
jgi:hypothetical protein